MATPITYEDPPDSRGASGSIRPPTSLSNHPAWCCAAELSLNLMEVLDASVARRTVSRQLNEAGDRSVHVPRDAKAIRFCPGGWLIQLHDACRDSVAVPP